MNREPARSIWSTSLFWSLVLGPPLSCSTRSDCIHRIHANHRATCVIDVCFAQHYVMCVNDISMCDSDDDARITSATLPVPVR